MGSTTDLLSSIIIGGLIFTMVLSLNYNLSTTMYHRSQDVWSQLAAVGLTDILEDDLFKVGYLATSIPLVRAESLAIVFLADIDDNGTLDSLRYAVGDTSYFQSTSNAADRPLFRRLNAESELNVAVGLTDFYFSYRDTAGNVVPYDSLRFEWHRSAVRLIGVTFTIEPSDPVDSTYFPVFVEKTLHPKNIGGW